MKKNLVLHKQRGMAVIAALLVVVAAAALASSVIERQGTLAHILTTERDRAQAQWLLQGGLDWSRVVLQLDAMGSPLTRADGLWTQPILDLPIGTADAPERALFSGQIEDEQSKYNLRNLAQGGQMKLDEVRGLENLLQWLKLEPSLAQAMAQRMADAQFRGDDSPRATGIRSLDDLESLEGVGAQTLAILQPYLTILPALTPVNVNTASAEVLAAVFEKLGLAGARDLTMQRDRGLWFTNQGDFINRVPSLDGISSKRISVNSNWFRVTGEVAIDDTIVSLRALLQRDKQGKSVIRWVSYQ